MREYGELLGLRPGQFGKFLDGDPPTVIIVLVLEAALVDDIGGLLAALGDDEVGAEVVGGGFQVGQRELRESRHVSVSDCGCGVVSVGQFGSVCKRRGVPVLSSAVLVFGWRWSSYKKGLAAAHNSAELTQCPTSHSSSPLPIIEREGMGWESCVKDFLRDSQGRI